MPFGPLVVKNGSKIFSRMCSGMPVPVSRTSTSTWPSAARVRRVRVPPFGIASTALSTRLVKASRSSAGSPATGGSPSARSVSTWISAPSLRRRSCRQTRLGGLEDLLDDLVEVHVHRRLVAPDAGEVLQPAHGAGAVHGRALDDLEPLAQLDVLDALEQELRAAQDGGEQVVEVVGHARRHLAERAQLLGAHELVLGGAQLAEGPRALLVEARAAEHEGDELGDVDEQPLVAPR